VWDSPSSLGGAEGRGARYLPFMLQTGAIDTCVMSWARFVSDDTERSRTA
jgi:hypothetical protein